MTEPATWPHFWNTGSLISRVLPAEEAQALLADRFPPRGRFLSVEGIDLHYVERGSGRPVVFLHGAGGMSQDFIASPLAASLARRYRTIVFDRPGFGHSTRPATGAAGPHAQARVIRAALAALKAERPIVIGHSWGGALALAYAADFPGAVSALVLLAGWAYPARRMALRLFSLPRAPLLGSLLQRRFWPYLARNLAPETIRRVFFPDAVPFGFRRDFPVELALRPSQLMADAEDLSLLNPCVAALQPLYPSLRVPVELVTGDRDRVVKPARHALRLAAVLPDGMLTVLKGVGHMLHHVAPDRVLAAVDRAAARSS